METASPPKHFLYLFQMSITFSLVADTTSLIPAQGINLIDASLPVQRLPFYPSLHKIEQPYPLTACPHAVAPYVRIFKRTRDEFLFTFYHVKSFFFFFQDLFIWEIEQERVQARRGAKRGSEGISSRFPTRQRAWSGA